MADQNIYISSTASPGGDGSLSSPYNSFSNINWTTSGDNSIFDWVAAGDDVFINLKRGETFSESLTVNTSGAENHPIVIQPYDTGDDPIIQNTITPVLINNVQYITIKNIVLDAQSSGLYGLDTTGTCSNLTIDSIEAMNATIYGASIKIANNSKILNSSFHNNTQRGLSITQSNDVSVLFNTAYENSSGGDNAFFIGFNSLRFYFGWNVARNNDNHGFNVSSDPTFTRFSGTFIGNQSYSNAKRGYSFSGDDINNKIDFIGNSSFDNGEWGLLIYEDITVNVYNNYFGNCILFSNVQFGLTTGSLSIVNFRGNVISGIYTRAIRNLDIVRLKSDYNYIVPGTISFAAIGFGINKTFEEWKEETLGDQKSSDTDPLVSNRLPERQQRGILTI